MINKAVRTAAPNVRISKIAPFSTSKSKELNIKLNMFMVQLEIGESTKDLISIKYLLHQRIYWEKKINKVVMRCYRCQRFGHSGECCSYNSRCVLCGESHDSEACIVAFKTLKETNQDVPIPKCVNCNATGHAASYQGCPAYLKYKEKREMLTQRARQVANKNRFVVEDTINTFTNTNVSFADKAKTSSSSGINHQTSSSSYKNHQPGDLNNFLNESKNLFNLPFKDLLLKIRQFWPKYQQLQTKEEKMFAYLDFVASIVV